MTETENIQEIPLTDFGYQQVPVNEKVQKVAAVFDSVAVRYDLMNDLMSLGIHRWWKQYTLMKANIRSGQWVLDVAGGTGDLAKQHIKNVGEKTGGVVLADINASMLQVGRERLLNDGIANIQYVQANAECLPFQPNQFDCITIAFGLRNVTRKEAALESMYRILKPGGKLLVLEFSKPVLSILEKLYDQYSFNILPRLGRWITGDQGSYEYLVESIRMHPNQENLKAMIMTAGFDQCEYENLSGGIVALHCAYKD